MGALEWVKFSIISQLSANLADLRSRPSVKKGVVAWTQLHMGNSDQQLSVGTPVFVQFLLCIRVIFFFPVFVSLFDRHTLHNSSYSIFFTRVFDPSPMRVSPQKGQRISPTQRPLSCCLDRVIWWIGAWEVWGYKGSARGTPGRGKRKERPFPSFHCPPHAFSLPFHLLLPYNASAEQRVQQMLSRKSWVSIFSESFVSLIQKVSFFYASFCLGI